MCTGLVLAGRSTSQTQAAMPEVDRILFIKVNPEIAVVYDRYGNVVAVEGRNDDGWLLITDDAEYEGRITQEVYDCLIWAR